MKIESGKQPTRTLALAWMAALAMSACGNDTGPAGPAQDPAAATAAAAAATAPAVPPPATARPPVQLSFSTDSAAIGSEVGTRKPGAGISTTGKAGWLVFGPYIAVDAGKYEAILVGFVEPDHSGSVHVDVASEKGERVIAALELDSAALLAGQSPGAMVVLPFTLESSVTDLEVRLRVDEKSRLAVSEFQIRSKP